MRRASLLIAAIILLAIPATAQAYQYTFATPIANQQKVQRALSFQLNRQVAEHWVIDPISFTASGGIPIVIVPDATVPCGPGAAGCHQWDGEQATIYIQQDGWTNESVYISHEIIETEIDPHQDRYVNGRLIEACDPVLDLNLDGFDGSYRLLGVWVEDFTYPSYWYGGGARRGHYDRQWMLARPAR